MTSPPVGALTGSPTTDEIIALALTGDRPALRAAVQQTVAAGDAGQKALDAAFTDLCLRPFDGEPDADPVVLLLQCCPHPTRTASGACTVCQTVLPPTMEVAMPDPGEPFDSDPRLWDRPDSPSLPVAGARSYELSPARQRTTTAMTDALTYLRAEMLRVDPKAGLLLSLATGLIVAALSILVAARLPGPAAAAVWASVAQHGLAVLLLTAAVRPRLDGQFGFCLWARMTPDAILADITIDADTSTTERLRDGAEQVHWLSRALLAKYRNTRTAAYLLVGGLATGALAAALTLWAR